MFTFSDVMFEPQYSEELTRGGIDLTSKLAENLTIKLPVVSANMPDITEDNMSIAMDSEGAWSIIHRFMPIDENVEIYRNAIGKMCMGTFGGRYYQAPGVSVGVQKEDKSRFEALCSAGARIFCVDVAHGHHVLVKNMVQWMREVEGDEITIIAGNVATAAGAIALVEWGADIVKVGIGPGSCCETRRNTGVGVPQLYAVQAIREALPNTPIIADGGIKQTGDIPKALYWADAVMMGKMFAGTIEAPGHVYEDDDGNFYKMFGGSASGENKVRHGKEHKFVEGHRTRVPFRGHVKFILRRIRENTQSCFSYAGAPNLQEFKNKAVLQQIGSGAKAESKYS